MGLSSLGCWLWSGKAYGGRGSLYGDLRNDRITWITGDGGVKKVLRF